MRQERSHDLTRHSRHAEPHMQGTSPIVTRFLKTFTQHRRLSKCTGSWMCYAICWKDRACCSELCTLWDGTPSRRLPLHMEAPTTMNWKLAQSALPLHEKCLRTQKQNAATLLVFKRRATKKQMIFRFIRQEINNNITPIS